MGLQWFVGPTEVNLGTIMACNSRQRPKGFFACSSHCERQAPIIQRARKGVDKPRDTKINWADGAAPAVFCRLFLAILILKQRVEMRKMKGHQWRFILVAIGEASSLAMALNVHEQALSPPIRLPSRLSKPWNMVLLTRGFLQGILATASHPTSSHLFRSLALQMACSHSALWLFLRLASEKG